VSAIWSGAPGFDLPADLNEIEKFILRWEDRAGNEWSFCSLDELRDAFSSGEASHLSINGGGYSLLPNATLRFRLDSHLVYVSVTAADSNEADRIVDSVRSALPLTEPESEPEGLLGGIIQDGQLQQRVTDLLTAQGNYDRAVSQAGMLLEHRVRLRIEAPDNVLGTELMTRAFRMHSGSLIVSDNDAEQEAAHQLFRGFIGYFKNPSSHRIVAHYNRDEAVTIVMFTDYLLRILGQARDRVQPQH
jgi:uncharacterized protein (TIGR02391 family)